MVEILLETEFVLLVEKAAGWLTTPARMADDPRPCLGRELQKACGRQIFPVHRLDFEVSGLTVWAKDADSHRVTQKWFEDGTIRKLYQGIAVARAETPPREFVEWSSRLVRGKKRTFAAAHGKPSKTLARVVDVTPPYWRWELVAVTGRPHQLRFEMAQHGCPLLGDTLYGGPPWPLPNALALRAVELNFAAIPVAQRLGLPEVFRIAELVLPQGVNPL